MLWSIFKQERVHGAIDMAAAVRAEWGDGNIAGCSNEDGCAHIQRQPLRTMRQSKFSELAFVALASDRNEGNLHASRGIQLAKIATHTFAFPTGTNAPGEESVPALSVGWRLCMREFPFCHPWS
jgi:hypothetical protein